MKFILAFIFTVFALLFVITTLSASASAARHGQPCVIGLTFLFISPLFCVLPHIKMLWQQELERSEVMARCVVSCSIAMLGASWAALYWPTG